MGWFRKRYLSERVQEHPVEPGPVQQTRGAGLLPPVREDRRGHRVPQRDGVRLQVCHHLQTSLQGPQRPRQDVSKTNNT